MHDFVNALCFLEFSENLLKLSLQDRFSLISLNALNSTRNSTAKKAAIRCISAAGVLDRFLQETEELTEDSYVSIGELVRITGCRYSTLKFYTEEGMLPFEQAEENLTRRFPREAAVARIEQIRFLRQDGLSIPAIKKLL